MRRITLIITLAAALVSTSHSQPSPVARTVRYGATVPSSCNVNSSNIFFKTESPNNGLYQCLAGSYVKVTPDPVAATIIYSTTVPGSCDEELSNVYFKTVDPDSGLYQCLAGSYVKVTPDPVVETPSGGSSSVFFPDDTSIVPVGTGPQNAYPINTLSPVPVTAAVDTDNIPCTAATSPCLVEAYLNNATLDTTTIPGGTWTFKFYAYVNSTAAGRVSSMTHRVNRVRSYAADITITNVPSTTSRTATAASGTPFSVANIGAGPWTASSSAPYLQTPKGLFMITSRTSDTVVVVTTLSTYTAEAPAISYSVWTSLFTVNSATITATAAGTLQTTNSTQGHFYIAATDKIGYFPLAVVNNTTTVSFTHNGTSTYSFFITPLAESRTALPFTSVPIPEAATAALGAAGALTGDVTYYISYVTAQGETLPSLASNTVNPSSQRVTVTVPLSTDPRVIARNIYRGGSIDAGGPYRLTAGITIEDNLSTTYDDNITYAGNFPRRSTSNSTSSTFLADGSKTGFAYYQNTAFGLNALDSVRLSDEEGVYETAFGWEALTALVAGKFNTAVGGGAMGTSTGTESGTCMGAVACQYILNGVGNTAVGSHALRLSTVNTSYNTAIGFYSMESDGEYGGGTEVGGNTAIGTNSLRAVDNGAVYNLVAGFNSGYPATANNKLKTGDYNILLGYATGMNGAQFDNCGAYGKGALCLESNAVYMGPNGGADQQKFVAAHITNFGIAPAIASGFGTNPAIVGGDNGGRLTVGTGGSASTGVINFGVTWVVAPACTANNETAIQLVQATATATTLTLTSAASWGASDKLTWTCVGY